MAKKTSDSEPKPPSAAHRRKTGKQARMLVALTIWLDMEKESYETYVRLHRIIYECDPDLDDVTNQFPSIDLDD